MSLVLGACADNGSQTAASGGTGAGGSSGGSTGASSGGLPSAGGTPSGAGTSGSGNAGSGQQAGKGGQAGASGSVGGTASGGRSGEASGGAAGNAASGGTATAGATASTGGRAATGGAGSSNAGNGAGGVTAGGQSGTGGRSISFGTLLNANDVMSSAQALAKSLAQPGSAQWRAKGDQRRTYRFADANANEPYRVCVPSSWDGQSELPLVMLLHGAGNDESSYLDQNSKQMVKLADQHGYLLVSPLGDKGAYGNFLRLSAPFGNESGAAQLMAQVTTDSEKTNELSERDVINVLEIVLDEYPVNRQALFLTGHSMGSGGTWYIGGKYATYWRAIAPMSGPFVQKTGYPWDNLRPISIFVTEGTQAPSTDASHLLRDWLKQNQFKSEYLEVNADHPGMVPLVLPNVFDFFDRSQ